MSNGEVIHVNKMLMKYTVEMTCKSIHGGSLEDPPQGARLRGKKVYVAPMKTLAQVHGGFLEDPPQGARLRGESTCTSHENISPSSLLNIQCS